MQLIRPNPFLNFTTHTNGLTLAWDNRTIRALSKTESHTFQKISNGTFSLSDAPAAQSLRRLFKDGLVVSESRAKGKAKHAVVHNRSFTFHCKDRVKSLSEKKIYQSFLQAIPELASVYLLITDRFFGISASEILSLAQGRPVLFINPFSQTPVVGPLVFTYAEWESALNILRKTWSVAIFEDALASFEPAEISFSQLSILQKQLAHWIQQNGLDRLKDFLISTDSQGKQHEHKLLRELLKEHDPSDALNLKNSIFQSEPICSSDGGFRTKTPEAVMEILRPYHDEITGIADVVEGAELQGLYTFRAFSYLQFLLQGRYLNLYSMGKGDSRAQSYVSCMAELLERFFSFTDLVEHSTQTGSFEHMPSAIQPDRLLLHSEKQYQQGPVEDGLFFRRIPSAYTNEQIEWVSVFSLSRQQEVWFPREYCYRKPSTKARHFLPTSNGIAAGNSYAEAILQGTFELIERDAAAIWWYNRIPRTQIDLEGLKIDVVQRCMQHFKSQGKVLRLLEITTDIEIPCYVALAYHPFERGSLQLGFGCHFSPRISISRATNELLQTDAAKVLKMQNLESEYSQYFEFENYNQTFLNPHNHSELRPEPEFSGTMNAALRQLLNILNRHSLDLHALDFSYPHHPIKVVRSMIPGLRSMMYELGPGRLFQVPVTMGHFPKPRNESEMNSYCLDI